MEEARAAFAEARTALLAVELPHEVVDIESGLAECAALEGDLDGAHRLAVAAIGTATHLGHGRRSATCTASWVSCSCGRGRAAEAARAFESGLAAPDAARVAARRPQPGGSRPRPPGYRGPDEEDLDTALAKLGGLGVEVLPHGLGRLGGRGALTYIVPRMSWSKRTSSRRSPALSRWLAT